MPDPMRIRAQTSGDKTTIQVPMAQEMKSGQRKDAAGKTIPAWFIQEVSVALNGKPEFSAHWGPSNAQNPYLQFALKGAKIGDKVGVSWIDNHGEKRSDEVAVVAATV